MRIFETHAHLDFPQFNRDRDEILKKCFKAGIEFIINVGVEKKSCRAGIKLAEKYDQIFASVGFHPHDAREFDKEFILKSARHPKVIAIGEIGLDFYRNLSPRDIQKRVFEEQIKIALAQNLPIIVHDRDAHEQCFDILSKYDPPKVVFHCFSGDEVFADKVISKGWHISFTGSITYRNSSMENVVRMVPQDRFFIETDSPYLSPVPNRGKRNSPLNLRYVIEKISEIRGMTPNRLAEITFQNAMNFFLPDLNY
ncbi:MAG: TatD family hydrolase [Candidatus Cloacimonetes bacterium]|nr:TatD family hydrolase [Candidatus Cloacimonadota bacterium]